MKVLAPRGLLICAFLLAGTLHARTSGFLSLVVPEFRVANATIVDACRELHKTGAVVTLETVAAQETIAISLDLRNRTIGEILDAIVAADKRYTWRSHFNATSPRAPMTVIDVLPINSVNGDQSLMNVRINKVDLKDVDAEDVFKSPQSVLPELLRAYVQQVRTPGGVSSEIMPLTPPTQVRRMSLKMANVTVREVLDEVTVLSGGIAWIYYGSLSRWQPFR